MSAVDQLDLGSHQRDVVLARVLEHADDAWTAAALRGIARLAASGRVFQAWDLIAAGVPEPDHPARWGALFQAAARAGLVEAAGSAPSLRPTVRGSLTRTWRGVDAQSSPTRPVMAVSLTRPWPWAVLNAGKAIENRTWAPRYRGLLVIHAAASWDTNARERIVRTSRSSPLLAESPWPGGRNTHPIGYVGTVELVDVCADSVARPYECACGPWSEPVRVHWHLANPRAFPTPVEGGGRLGLWRPPPAVVDVALAVSE